MTNLFSILCILIQVLSRAQAKGAQRLNNFEFGIFIGRFPSDDAASLAVKGLKPQPTSGHFYRLLFSEHGIALRPYCLGPTRLPTKHTGPGTR